MVLGILISVASNLLTNATYRRDCLASSGLLTIAVMGKTAPLGLRIEPELKAEIEKLAAADKRSVAAYVEIVLQAHVDAQRKKSKAK